MATYFSNFDRSLLLVGLVLLLFVCRPTFAQQVQDRPMSEWKADDCLKILNQSPWAYSFTDINIDVLSRGINERLMFGKVSPAIVVRWYSAQTVRRAMVRLTQIGQKYDQMSAAQKSEFDARSKKTLECELCEKYYILVLIQPASPDAKLTLIGERFKPIAFKDIKDHIYMVNEAGDKRGVVQYVAPQSENGFAVFYFDRFDEKQKPLVSSDAKRVRVVFKLASINARLTGLLEDKVDFSTSKMQLDKKTDL